MGREVKIEHRLDQFQLHDGQAAVDSNQVFIDGLKVPLEDRIGEEGKGFQ